MSCLTSKNFTTLDAFAIATATTLVVGLAAANADKIGAALDCATLGGFTGDPYFSCHYVLDRNHPALDAYRIK